MSSACHKYLLFHMKFLEVVENIYECGGLPYDYLKLIGVKIHHVNVSDVGSISQLQIQEH
jgi:hypothetical protein